MAIFVPVLSANAARKSRGKGGFEASGGSGAGRSQAAVRFGAQMHPSAYRNGRRFVNKYLAGRSPLAILDVGSLDVNGTLRPLFKKTGWNYFGLDLEGGPEENVDCHALEDGSFPFEDACFDVIVSTSCLEHDRSFWRTFSEMIRVGREGALIYLNVPSEGPYHPFPQDCWRFLGDAHEAMAQLSPEVELLESYISREGQWHDNVGIFRVSRLAGSGGEGDGGKLPDTAAAPGSAEVVLGHLWKSFRPESVVDVGCGNGAWLQAAGKLGAGKLLGLDRARNESGYLLEYRTFLPADLELPLPLEGRFDLVISLETAEHLSPGRAGSFIADLVRLGDVVLFSAAIPFQDERAGRNEQWPEYWASFFDGQGYQALDIIRPAVRGDQRVAWRYQQNVLVFCRRERLSRLFPGAPPADHLALGYVHESAYLRISEYQERARLLEHQARSARAFSAGHKAALDEARRELEALRNSTSWKVTGPVRKAKDLLAGLLKPGQP